MNKRFILFGISLVNVMFIFACPLFSSFGPISGMEESAGSAREIRLSVQRILVDSCNAQGSIVPFSQIAAHRVGTDIALRECRSLS